jgi:hypothetical protein
MLLIYLPAITSRSEYVFELIFKYELSIKYDITTDIKFYETHKYEKINYSSKRIGEEIFIKASPLLFECSIEKINISVEKKYETTVLFSNNASCDIGFDIFAAVFYMVSRYEEYLPFIPDKHGRFKAADSLAFQNNFLPYPVVNIWIKYFKHSLLKKYPSLQIQSTIFKALITYDIDVAYAFTGRNMFRSAGATVNDIVRLKFKNIFKRISVLFNGEDPWDVYDFLKATITKNNLSSIFFFLLGDYSRHDKNINFNHRKMTELVNKVSEFSDIGIHPSYKSSVHPEKILIEKARLEKIAGKQITKSRQHYLKFNLPGTYNQLLAAGIAEDFSMGFADTPGFRAGTCTPFYFYDLENESSTGLKIFPMTCMEAGFLYYSKLNPNESLGVILALINEVKKVEGLFICIWHNNTVSDDRIYKNWKWVHNEMIKGILEIS